MTKVAGYCPMGCGETLFLGSGGFVTCGLLPPNGCPNPTAVDTILHQREHMHIVVFTDHGFNIQHPLRERVHGELFDCGLHAYCSALAGPPVKPGRYRVWDTGKTGEKDWYFEELQPASGTFGKAAKQMEFGSFQGLRLSPTPDDVSRGATERERGSLVERTAS